MATCPECDFDEIDTDDCEDGDEISCPECGQAFVVSGGELEYTDDEDDDDDLDDEEEEEEEEDEEEPDLDDEEEGLADEEEEDFDE